MCTFLSGVELPIQTKSLSRHECRRSLKYFVDSVWGICIPFSWVYILFSLSFAAWWLVWYCPLVVSILNQSLQFRLLTTCHHFNHLLNHPNLSRPLQLLPSLYPPLEINSPKFSSNTRFAFFLYLFTNISVLSSFSKTVHLLSYPPFSSGWLKKIPFSSINYSGEEINNSLKIGTCNVRGLNATEKLIQ